MKQYVCYLGEQPMAAWSSFYLAAKWASQFGNAIDIREEDWEDDEG